MWTRRIDEREMDWVWFPQTTDFFSRAPSNRAHITGSSGVRETQKALRDLKPQRENPDPLGNLRGSGGLPPAGVWGLGPQKARGTQNGECSSRALATYCVELRGIEPLTFSMRTRRATNCATAPCGVTREL